MTDDLIARLTDDLKPVARNALIYRLAAVVLIGFVVAAPVMLAWLGLRPDLHDAMGSRIFWIKSGYTAGLGLAGIWAVERLGRPECSGRWPLTAAFALFLVAAAAAVADYALAPAAARRAILMGSSALVCPLYIMALSFPFFAVVMAFMRRLAPTELTLAGAAAGLLAGGLGAWVYSFHCTEGGLPFLAVWYSLGVLAVALAGALLGRSLLRW